MQALQKTSRLATGVWARSLVKPQFTKPALTRGITVEQKQKRDIYREKMQYPDDTPVFLRGGSFDKVLFGLTCILVASNLLFNFHRIHTWYKKTNG